MGKPAFRVIQTHFAAKDNVGAVAAKEEVWEVVAQLAGYASSVAVLSELEAGGSWERIVGVWALVQGLHVLLRYKTLGTLRFSSFNKKRACMLAMQHVAGQPLSNVTTINQQEPFLIAADDVLPRIVFGCSVQEAFGEEYESAQLQGVLELYCNQQYILLWRDQRAYVLLNDDYTSEACLKAIWQAAWLEQNFRSSVLHAGPSAEGGVAMAAPGQTLPGDSVVASEPERPTADIKWLQQSVEQMQAQFGDFMLSAAGQGWQADGIVVKTGGYRVSVQ